MLFQEHRKRLNSTIKIQAYVRSYLTRKHCKQNEREEFDNIFPKVSADNADMLCLLVSKILFFYDDKEDSSRLVIFFNMNNFGIRILVAIKIIVTNLIIAIWFIIIDCILSFFFFQVSVSQLLLKQWRKVFQSGGCSVQIRRLLALHLKLLREESEVCSI